MSAGHGCVGCSEPNFWDTNTPFYDRLPHVQTAGLDLTADRLGIGIVAATAAGFALHAVGKGVQHRVAAAHDSRAAHDAQAAQTPKIDPKAPGGGGDATAEAPTQPDDG